MHICRCHRESGNPGKVADGNEHYVINNLLMDLPAFLLLCVYVRDMVSIFKEQFIPSLCSVYHWLLPLRQCQMYPRFMGM